MPRLFSLAVCLTLLCFASQAQAQSLFGSSGGATSGGSRGGSSTGGMSTGGMSTGGMSTGGVTSGGRTTSGAANTSQFNSGARGGAAGGGRNGAAGQMGPAINAGDGSLATMVSNSGFLGQSNANSFLGINTTGQTGRTTSRAPNFSALQGGARGMGGSTLVGSGMNGMGGQNGMQQQGQQIRPQLRLGFQEPALPAALVQTTLQQRMEQLPAAVRNGNIGALVSDDGVVTLSGTVATEEDRQLMEALLRLEPGVSDVRNELQLAR